MKLLLLLLSVLYRDNHVLAHNEECTRTDCRSDYKAAVQTLSDALSSTFQDIVVTELGTEVAGASETGTVSQLQATDEDMLLSITNKLGHKLSIAAHILRDMNSTLASNSAPSFTHPCPYKSIHKSVFINAFEPQENLSSATDNRMKDRFRDLKIKRKYFLAHIDYATDKDCAAMPHSNLRYLYHKIVNPEPKLVIFIIDNSISADAVQYAVGVVKEINRALQASDMLALKMTNTTDFVKFEDICSNDGTSDIGNATENNKSLLREYASSIDTAHSTVPHATINQQLRALLSKNNLPKHKLIIFLTDTKVLTDETWPRMFPYPIKQDDTIKLAIGVISAGDVDRNSSLEILHFDRWHNHSKSRSLMRVPINNSGVLGQVASAFISLMPQAPESNKMVVMTPVWEATERDFMVPLVIPTRAGVLGLDLYWTDLAEDVIYFQQTIIGRRAFIIDCFGRVIMHSHFPRPELTTEKIKFTELNKIENFNFIESVKKIMLTSSKGKLTKMDEFTNKSISYTWERVAELYIACVASEADKIESYTKANMIYTRSNKEILFHRLDLFPPKSGKLCRHFKQIATIEQGTIYLSPSSFQSPFTYLHDTLDGQEAVSYMQNYLAYLRSVAHGLLSNPGLKEGIQQDAGFLNSLLGYYKRQQLHGAHSRYVVRRYVATESGVLAMFPGTVLEADYEPVRRAWYARAAARPGRLVLSPPALDVGGAGYVVTLSYAVRSALGPRVVAAMDVTMGFLHKLLVQAVPACAERGVRCFVMDSRGYLVSHPGLLDPRGAAPIEQQHVTHKESVIALDLLNHRSFVTKRLCDNLADQTVQRFYEFNSSVPGVISNAASGDHCLHYYITAVPGTDAFVALVNATCSAGAFCPCSMVDRLCLNCNRMEQGECECPCECVAERAHCTVAPPAPRPAPPPPCGRAQEGNSHKSHYFHNFAENLKSCFEWECGAHASFAACLGVVGCEWCQLEADARSPLAAPFCAPQSACFSGVLGALTPYGEGTFRGEPAGYSALGPVVGCLVTAGLVAAVAAYCYRQSAGGGGARLQLYAEGAEPWAEPEPAVGAEAGRERLLPAPVSPYRVVGGVRRARQGSDHGYSTMTPHEDSETTGAAGDPAPLSDDTRSDVSCPLPRRTAPLPAAPRPSAHTALSARVLAPVTVHRHMEAS